MAEATASVEVNKTSFRSFRDRRSDREAHFEGRLEKAPPLTADRVETNDNETAEFRRYADTNLWPNRTKMANFLKAKDNFHGISDTSHYALSDRQINHGMYGRKDGPKGNALLKVICKQYLDEHPQEGRAGGSSTITSSTSTTALSDDTAQAKSKAAPVHDGNDPVSKKRTAEDGDPSCRPAKISKTTSRGPAPLTYHNRLSQDNTSQALAGSSTLDPIVIGDELTPVAPADQITPSLAVASALTADQATIQAQRYEISRLNMLLNDRPEEFRRQLEAKEAHLRQNRKELGKLNEQLTYARKEMQKLHEGPAGRSDKSV